MTWRSLLIQNGGKLSLQRRQLLIQQNGESHTVPLEDIAVIIIENRETLTVWADTDESWRIWLDAFKA